MLIDVKKLPAEYGKLFIADGAIGLPKNLRSKWHDYQELRRRGNKRDFLSNVWGVCIGSSDMVFDSIILEKIKNTMIRPAEFAGEVIFEYENDKVINPKFKLYFGKQRLQWWGELIGGRPNQNHNYIAAFDISFGLGSSNSVIEIYDCNTKEQVGEWVDCLTRENDLADMGVAVAKWTGGADPCFMIWENNGGQGSTFRQRILYQDYYYVYFRKKEEAKYRKASDMYGWRSGAGSKEPLLAELGVALSCGLNNIKDFSSIKIHSKDLLDELFDYVWYENGDCGTSKTKDMKTGAKKRHGDRVIPIGLCILATRDQPKGVAKHPTSLSVNSFVGRMQHYLDEQQEKEKNEKIWMF